MDRFDIPSELTESERFVLHSVMSSLILEQHTDIKISHAKLLEFILQHRCRNLPIEKVNALINNIGTELLLAKSMWDEFLLHR